MEFWNKIAMILVKRFVRISCKNCAILRFHKLYCVFIFNVSLPDLTFTIKFVKTSKLEDSLKEGFARSIGLFKSKNIHIHSVLQ